MPSPRSNEAPKNRAAIEIDTRRIDLGVVRPREVGKIPAPLTPSLTRAFGAELRQHFTVKLVQDSNQAGNRVARQGASAKGILRRMAAAPYQK